MKTKNMAAIIIAWLIFYPPFCFGADHTIKIFTKISSPPNLSLLKEAAHSLKTAHTYLLDSQMPNGSWKDHPAITALVMYSFLLPPLYNPNTMSEDALQKGFEYLEKFVQPDGGIYREEYKNYVTAVCLLAFAESGEKKYETIVKNAKNFLIKYQVDEGENISKNHPYYGGIGYGGDDRPDLSNTQFALDAIKAAENYELRYSKIIPDKADQVEKEEAELGLHWQKAIIFLARCQNVKAVNDMPYAENDGGFIYETGTYKKERSHSYGSMTYAGVKSLLYARVDKDDIRVKKAVSWIKSNYTLEENPGFGQVALYYYYMTFAKCLDALGEEIIVDDNGQKHYWRKEFLKKLISLQFDEGYWVHTDGRYWHKNKDLVTAYAIIGIKFAVRGMLEKG